jgi:hypothetical protein
VGNPQFEKPKIDREEARKAPMGLLIIFQSRKRVKIGPRFEKKSNQPQRTPEFFRRGDFCGLNAESSAGGRSCESCG